MFGCGVYVTPKTVFVASKTPFSVAKKFVKETSSPSEIVTSSIGEYSA